jgi:hypothetical protein
MGYNEMGYPRRKWLRVPNPPSSDIRVQSPVQQQLFRTV